MVNKGAILGELGQMQAALALFEELVGQFSDDTDATIDVCIACAWRNSGILLEDVERPEAARHLYAEIIARFGAADELGSVRFPV